MSMIRTAVFAVILLMGCALLALAPKQNADATDMLVARLHVELPDLAVAPSSGFLQSDMLYVSADPKGRGSDPRPIARIRAVSRDSVRVAMYNADRRGFGREATMDMPTAVSRLGLAAGL